MEGRTFTFTFATSQCKAAQAERAAEVSDLSQKLEEAAAATQAWREMSIVVVAVVVAVGSGSGAKGRRVCMRRGVNSTRRPCTLVTI